MKFYVSDISFDFSDSCYELSQNDKIDITDNSLGLWEAKDDDDLVEVITNDTGYCVNTIDYEMDMTQEL